MFDTKQLLDQFLGAGQNAGSQAGGIAEKGKSYLQNNAGGIAGGALAGGLAGVMMGSKKGRKLGKKAVQYGSLALIGGLAYKAYQSYQSGKQAPAAGGAAPTPPSGGAPQAAEPLALPDTSNTQFDPANQPVAQDEQALALVIAMIQAAKADGHIDGSEQERIFSRISEAGLGVEAKAFIMDELQAPLDIEKVIASATSPEMAIELYTVSRLAIDPKEAAERAYLMLLAARLGLEDGLVAEIDAAVRQAQASE
ncbi:tellurite resistance TerB family protein [Rhodobacteraceae bacterium RKSG542]|uniref:tellurite resistance TerB family protein n=1 Tax=Pseudovibrio flavus TaxID=2529854 RepID=UPI0012BC006A|nr:tellurite resistance TerB family protein [Pseudovibrio flavus]MTI16787.1 tellurite resistance TerB family protein [Pseudovibrio flavus]